MSTPTLVSRADIHKSCKTIEAVVNLLNDYSEAVTAIIGIQKKLAKALREAASTKIAAEVAANALNASATVFDTLGDVDTKFAKLVDGECENTSSEVKKWFKKLAKEERHHDQKLASANDKIKQAGGYYERKVKKNPADAGEEHTRYINLLTTLGQETSQEKYNHSVMVNERQGSTLFHLASSLSRVADGEWSRVCEELRRVSPYVGQLGEWRTFAEANWTDPIPPYLPEMGESAQSREAHEILSRKIAMQELRSPEPLGTPAPEYASRAVTPTEASPQLPTYFSPDKQSKPESASVDPEDDRGRGLSVNSIASLGSFPSPPTHFPLPPVPGTAVGNVRQPSSQSSQSSSSVTQHQPSELVAAPETPKMSDATGANKSKKDSATFLDFSSPPASPTTATQNTAKVVPSASNDPNILSSESRNKEPVPELESPQRSAGASPVSDVRHSRVYPVGDYMGGAEFGAPRLSSGSSKPGSSPHTSMSKTIERSDTNRSSGSVVSAIRDKYTRSTGPASPPPKDIPRLPLSVSNLATRFDNSLQGEQTIPMSPSTDSGRLSSEPRSPAIGPSMSNQSYFPEDSKTGDIARRQQRIQELEDLELREREYAFRMKEREMRDRARELEKEQYELIRARQTRLRADSTPDLHSQGVVTPRPSSYASSSLSGQQHPYISSNRVPIPSSSQRHLPPTSSSQPSTPISTHPLRHAESNDVAPLARTTKPLAGPVSSPRPDKPKGNWIRRLSMPVMGNAFQDSGKKGISSTNAGTQAYHRNSLALPEEDGRIRKDVISTPKNRSVTSLIRR